MLLAERGTAPPWVDVDAGDDAAVLGDGTAVTVDAMVEGSHFDDRLSPADVGFKLVAVSVSDLAAVGARPRWAVLAASLPTHEAPWVSAFAAGLSEACARWDVYLLGGDTTGAPPGAARTLSLTLVGACVGVPLRRSGGRPGDHLWVTGTPGLAGAGWRLDDPPPAALDALRRPDPPLAFALRLAETGAVHAAMDLSDGLATDLPRLCAASDTGARVDPERLPTAPCLADRADRVDLQLASGDDFELLLAAAPEADAAVRAAAAATDTRVTRIGTLTDDRTIALTTGGWPTAAFDHFAGGRS